MDGFFAGNGNNFNPNQNNQRNYRFSFGGQRRFCNKIPCVSVETVLCNCENNRENCNECNNNNENKNEKYVDFSTKSCFPCAYTYTDIPTKECFQQQVYEDIPTKG